MATTTDIMYEGVRTVALHITNESEAASDENNVLKLDISNLQQNPVPNQVPISVTLLEACWNVTGFNYVVVKWDKDGTDEVILLCNGDGSRNFESFGGKHASSAPGKNDVLVSTDGGADGDSYDIFLIFKLEY